MHLSEGLQTSNPHDQVYGLLELTKKAPGDTVVPSLLDEGGRNHIEVYGDVTRLCIQESGRLAILGSRSNKPAEELVMSSRGQKIPSWIPRWDLDTKPQSQPSFSMFHNWTPFVDSRGVLGLHFDKEKEWQAAMNQKALVSDTGDARDLRLRGLAADKISWWSNVLPDRDSSWQIIQDRIRETWEAVLERLGIEVTIESRRMKDTAYEFHKVLAHYRLLNLSRTEMIQDFWRLLYHCYVQRELQKTIDSSSLNIYEKLGRGGEDYHVISLVEGQRFFLTQTGHFGLEGCRPEVGDDIFVLFGGHVPFMLRKYFDGHLLIGEAVLDHLMRGQAIKQWEEGVLIDQWVSLW